MVDLVGNDGDAQAFGGFHQHLQRVDRNDGACRIGRTGEQHALERLFLVRGLHVLRMQVGIPARFDFHDLDAQRRHDVAIGGIAGRGDGHPVSGVEHGKESKVEGRRGACRHGNTRG